MKSENLSKAELRKNLLFARKWIPSKNDKDSVIVKTLINLPQYKSAKTILLYMALDDEINVDSIVELARYSQKSIAVPYCIDSNGNMEFFYINTLDELKPGSFGVREPDIDKCKKVTDFSDSIIIVPAIAFDKQGYRLGYGKGYYDRFLQNNSLFSIGLCYNSLVKNELPINEFDQSVDMIVTETRIINITGGYDG